jgi:hypothetical protein
MKPRVRIAAARTPDGGEMVLYQHDRDLEVRRLNFEGFAPKSFNTEN